MIRKIEINKINQNKNKEKKETSEKKIELKQKAKHGVGMTKGEVCSGKLLWAW